MADIESNIDININTAGALQSIKALQREISAFHSSMATNGAAANVQSSQMQARLVNNINATGKFSAQMKTIASTTDTFNTSLEKNKLSMGEYFRYAGASTKTFGSQFKSEFATINKVARESVKDLQTQYIKLGRDASGSMQSIAVRPMALDMKDFGTQTALASAKSQIFNKLVDQGSTNLLNWGKNTQWAGRQLMVGFTLPLGIFATLAAKSFMDIEKSLVQFRRVYGDAMTPDAEISGMTDQIKEVASAYTQYGVAVSDTIDLAARSAAMGNTGDALVGAVSQTAKLAVLGGIDQQKALETVTSLTNTFGIATKDLAMNIDLLNAVENQTVLNIDDLTTAIPIAAPVIAALGGDIGDLTVMLVAMKEGGINASQGANALKSGLASLINPASSAVTFLGDLGVNITALRDANRGNAAGMISGLAKELDKLDPLNRAQAIEQLFGKFQFARMSTLLANINKEGGQAARALELTTASAGELAALSSKELSAISDSPAFKFDKMVEDLKVSIAPIGEAFLELAIPIMQAGVQILGFFNDMSGSAKKWTVGIIAFFGAIVPVAIMGLGLLANGFANLIKGVLYIGRTFFGVGKNSRYLGDETKYMSQAQRDAAAVASSLDQVHSQLIQRFTSEREAVDKLTEAYRRSILEQGGMRGAPMASTLPGAKNSEDTSGSGAQGRVGKSGMAVVRQNLANVSAGKAGLVQFGDIDPKRKADLASMYSKTIISEAQTSTSAINAEIGTWRKTNSAAITKATKAYEDGATQSVAFGALTKKFNQDMTKAAGPVSKFSSTATQIMPRLEADLAQAQAEAKRLKLNLRTGAGTTALAAALPGNIAAQGLASPGSFSGQSKVRQAAVSMFGTAKDKSLYGIPRILTDEAITGNTKSRLSKDTTSQEHVATTIAQEQNAKDLAQNRRKTGTSQALIDAMEGRTEKAKKAYATQERIDNQGLVLEEDALKAHKKSIASVKAAEKRKLSSLNKSAEISQQQVITDQETLASSKATAKAAARQKLQKIASVASGVGMATGMIGMAVSSMGGPVGEVLAPISGVVTTISSMGMALSMIPGPVGLVVAGLIGFIAGISAVVGVLDNAKKEGQAIANAMSATADKISGFGEASGTIGISEKNRTTTEARIAALSVKTPEQEQFGNKYIASDAGKSFLSDVRTQIKSGEDVKDIAKNIASQLATGVAQGVLSKNEAASIATSMSIALKDASFGVNVEATLSKILGPNGEDLAKDPLKVTLALTKINEDQTASVSKKAMDANYMPDAEKTSVGMGLLAAGGVTTVLAGWTGVGAILGGVIAVAGGVVIALEAIGTEAQNVKNAALLVGSYTNAYKQNISLLDVIGQQYDNIISTQTELAKAATTEEERKRILQEIIVLEKDRASAIAKQNSANQDLVGNALKAKTELEKKSPGKWDTAMGDQIGMTYKDDALAQEQARSAYANTKTSNIKNTEAVATVQLQISSGALAPGVAENLLVAMNNNEKVQKNYVALMSTAGAQSSIDMVSSLTAMGATSDTIAKYIAVTVSASDPSAEVQRIMELMDIAKSLEALNISINIDDSEGQKSLNRIQQSLSDYEEWFADGKNNEEVFTKFTSMGFTMTSDQMAYYNSLPPDQQKVYTAAYLTVSESIDTGTPEGRGRLRQWAENSLGSKSAVTSQYGNNGKKTKIGGVDYKWDYNAIAKDMVDQSSRSAAAARPSAAVDPGDSPDMPDAPAASSGGGSQAQKDPTSFLDSVIKKLRDVKAGALDLTETFNSSFASLSGFMGAGGGGSAFNGLEQQMRSLGAGQDVISLVTGMSAEDYTKYKDQMFNFDSNGNVTALKSMLIDVGNAFRLIALGDFQNKQKATIATFNDQTVAIRKLVAVGISYSDAYEVVKDATLASSIAQESNNSVIKEAVKQYSEAERVTKLYAAAQAVAGNNQATTDKSQLLSYLKTNASKYTNAQIEAILADENLQKLVLNPNIDPVTLQKALDDAANKAAMDIEIKKLTIGGMEEIFSDGLNKAMESFAAQEKIIDIKFNEKKSPFEAIAEKAQNLISDLTNAPGGLNDLEADITRIEKKEVDINDKYADRLTALDKIQAANDAIALQQRSQLNLADALSQGDISAAAAAVQEMRATETANAMTTQKKLLGTAKEAEIAAVLGDMGLTRSETEARVRDLKTEIFNIEQNTLEPAQRAIELLTRKEEKEKNSLTVLGKTKDEWEKIDANIKLAKTNSDTYRVAMEQALTVVSGILNYWKEIEKPKNTTHTITTVYVSGPTAGSQSSSNYGTSGSGGSGGAGGGGGSPSNTPAPPVVDPKTTAIKLAERYAKAYYSVTRGSAASNSLVKDYLAYKSFIGPTTSSTPVVANLNKRLVSMGYNTGGFVNGLGNKDKISAMLTPGEFVITKPAVAAFGASKLASINNGKYNESSMYTSNNSYSINVNVKSDSNPDQIAKTVIAQIKQIDSQRLRGNRF